MKLIFLVKAGDHANSSLCQFQPIIQLNDPV